MKIKRSDVFGLEKVFNSLMEAPLDPEVAYKVASNGILASEFTEKIRKSYKAVEGYDEIQKLRADLIKNGGGEAQTNGSFSIPPEKAAAISAALETFGEEHKAILEAQDEYQAKFDAMLDKESDVDFKTINRKELTTAIEPGKLVLMIKVGILADGDK
jgi:hypothetical protein